MRTGRFQANDTEILNTASRIAVKKNIAVKAEIKGVER